MSHEGKINPWIQNQMKGEHKPGTLFNYTGPTTVAVALSVAGIDVYYCDKAIIAFCVSGLNMVISENVWGADAERQLLELCNMYPKDRMPREAFKATLHKLLLDRGALKVLTQHGLAI